MPELRAVLEAIGALPDHEIDVADAALHLARAEAPDADWRAARAHLTDIAQQAAHAAMLIPDADLLARANALSRLLHERFGYRGDIETYDDLANADLLQVIDRRRGLPVALGILWLHAASAANWPAHGIDVPGHFVVGLTSRDGAQLVLDVFDGGTPLNEADIGKLLRRGRRPAATVRPRLRPMSNRDVLLRLQANIRLRRAQSGDLEGALRCVETTLCIAPGDALLWGEAAHLQESLDRVAAALHSYERCLALTAPGPQSDSIRALMDQLRARLN